MDPDTTERQEDYSAVTKAITASAVALDTMARAAPNLNSPGLKPRFCMRLLSSHRTNSDPTPWWTGCSGSECPHWLEVPAAVRMPGRLMILHTQEQHIRLDEDQLITETADLKMTDDSHANDTAASEDTTQDCLEIQAEAVEFKAYNKSLSEDLEALVKAKAVISGKTVDVEYQDNWSVLSSREVWLEDPRASTRSNWRSSHLVWIPRCTPRSVTTTILSRRSRV